MKKFDVVVVGGGHAGIEAAIACAKLGCSVLVITFNLDLIGHTSCNPAVGGVSKAHLVKEVNALGGLIAKITDLSAIQYRRLNKKKGPAVWSTRCQIDRALYRKYARKFLEENINISLYQAEVTQLLIKDKKIEGVITDLGEVFYCKCVILAPGTFLGGLIHIGLQNFHGGRLGEKASLKLKENLKELGFKLKSFKTGTCARLDKRTIDFSKMTPQYSEEDVECFSEDSFKRYNPQKPCYITYTNEDTHKIILKNLDKSPLYTGIIKSTGVRYCPSLEDKVVKFRDRQRHQVFIEPEGIDTIEVYPNGISTSLPLKVQEDFIHTIPGLENVKILRPGYGIEHTVIDSTQLFHTLESKLIEGLFFAGQINGTTGYEEAAAQGIVAGINAGLKVKKRPPFILERTDGYIGVLIDDLVTKGTQEPYRMFTSRAELRLLFRESNADLRLGKKAFELGLISKEDFEKIKEKQIRIKEKIKELESKKIYPKKEINQILEETFCLKIENALTLKDLLKKPQISISKLFEVFKIEKLNPVEMREVEIEIKYEGFIKRQKKEAENLKYLKNIKIPEDFDFASVSGLSTEIREKLSKFRPKDLGQALQISGVTPASVVLLAYYIKKHNEEKRVRSSI